MKRSADFVRESISSDIVRLDERCIKQIAQRNAIARLKPDQVFAGADKCLLRNRHHLIQIAAAFFRPIEHDHRGRDFGQAADLAFVSRLNLVENEAALSIDDDISGPGRFGGATKRKKEGERKKCGEKAARNHCGNENRCTLNAAVAFATAESESLRN